MAIGHQAHGSGAQLLTVYAVVSWWERIQVLQDKKGFRDLASKWAATKTDPSAAVNPEGCVLEGWDGEDSKDTVRWADPQSCSKSQVLRFTG